ncbi:MAG: hypothetical protein QG657_439 [Acidobacteriota bacterium]|nr:hypothetical protein [Acidobacteriota bacterium]
MSDKIKTDLNGVWIQTDKGTKSGIRWDEVYSISISAIDGIIKSYRYLTFDFEFGEFIETYDQMEGFDELLDEVSKRFLLPKDFRTKLFEMQAGDVPLTIWQKC